MSAFTFSRSTDALFRYAHDESVRRTVASYELGDEKSGGGLGLGWAGLEPAANALKGRCSTIELPTPGNFSLSSLPSESQPTRKLSGLLYRLSHRPGGEPFSNPI